MHRGSNKRLYRFHSRKSGYHVHSSKHDKLFFGGHCLVVWTAQDRAHGQWEALSRHIPGTVHQMGNQTIIFVPILSSIPWQGRIGQ